MGILFKLCCSLSSNSCSCTQMEKHLVRKQQISVFQDRIQLLQLLRLHSSRFYFFFAMTFLQTQFMPSFEGNGQRKAVLVVRKSPHTQAQERGKVEVLGPPSPTTSSREYPCPRGPPGSPGTVTSKGGGGRPLRAPEGNGRGSAQCLNLRWVLRNSL